MSEMLIPAKYTGEGAGISAKFIGLNNDSYDELSISLGDGEFIKVSRNDEIPFMSTIAQFGGLELNGIYRVRGRIIQNGVEKTVECSMVGSMAFKATYQEPRSMPSGAAFHSRNMG